MPHIVVKLWPGSTPEQKQRLTDHIVQGVADILHNGSASVSVGFEEVSPGQWQEAVFEPDILGRWDKLTKQPGYGERPD